MDLGFHGDVVEYYHRYRHGYPEAVISKLAGLFGLDDRDVVVDLGCGTGQLTLALAGRVRAVLGVDPEPDMLRRARQAASDAQAGNVSWMLGADNDLPVLRRLLGEESVAAVTIAQALHWMQAPELFRAAAPLIRPGGGVAVVTNGTPLWLQDTDWSRALRGFLTRWLGHEVSSPCGTDEQSQQRYRRELAAVGYDVAGEAVDYEADLDLDQIIGSVLSAIPASRLPPAAQRPEFARQLGQALGGADRFTEGADRFTEQVHVTILAGRLR